MTGGPHRRRGEDDDLDARFAEIVAGLDLSEPPEDLHREDTPPDGPRRDDARGEEARHDGTHPEGPRPEDPRGEHLRPSGATDPGERGRGPRSPGAGEDPPDADSGRQPETHDGLNPAPDASPGEPTTWREWADPEVEEHFIPPDPPPLPAGDLHFWGIVVGLLGGPLVLFLAHGLGVLDGSVWSWVGILLALGGFALLVLRLPTHRDDDPSGGARV